MNFILKIIFFFLFSQLLGFCVNYLVPISFKTEFWFLPAFFFFTFGIISIPLISATIDDPQKSKFTFRFMGMTGLKLFLSLIFLLIYKFLFEDNFKGFTLQFLLQYFSFIGFELFLLLKELQKAKKPKNQMNSN